MSAAEKGKRIRLRQKVSRVGLMLMIVVLVWYLYVTVRKGEVKPAPVPWRTPQRAQGAGDPERYAVNDSKSSSGAANSAFSVDGPRHAGIVSFRVRKRF